MKNLLRLAVSAALLAFAFTLLDTEALIRSWQKVSLSTFSLAISINILTFGVMGLRWYGLISTKLGYCFCYQLALYFRSAFLNVFTPANLGGDAYRLVMLKESEISSGELIKLLLRERILGLNGYVIVFVIAYALISIVNGAEFSKGNPYLYGLIVAAVVLLLPLLSYLSLSRGTGLLRAIIGEKRFLEVEGWLDDLVELLSPKGSFWLMTLTLFGILLWVLSILIVSQGLGLFVPVLHLAAAAALVELIRLVPFTVQGVGLREGVFSYLLAFFGHNPEQCYMVGLISYLFLSISIALCGPIGLIMAGCCSNKGQVCKE